MDMDVAPADIKHFSGGYTGGTDGTKSGRCREREKALLVHDYVFASFSRTQRTPVIGVTGGIAMICVGFENGQGERG